MKIKTVDATQLDADLKTVADSIRAKSGTTEQLVFPSGFKSAVENINTSKEEQEKTVDITENGTTEVIADEGKVLSKVTVNVEVESGGGSSLFGELTNYSFDGNKTLERIDEYLENPVSQLQYTFRNTTNLKYIKGLNTSKCTQMNATFSNSALEIIEEPLDLSSLEANSYNHTFKQATKLVEVRIVPSTIFIDIVFLSQKLSEESIQSIIDGLADLTETSAKTLTFYATIRDNLTETQIATITSKNWTLA